MAVYYNSECKPMKMNEKLDTDFLIQFLGRVLQLT